MSRLKEIQQSPPIRCVAIYPDRSKKVRLFPDDKEGLHEAVIWEWEQINQGACIIEYYREDIKKGTFYSPHWERFSPRQESNPK